MLATSSAARARICHLGSIAPFHPWVWRNANCHARAIRWEWPLSGNDHIDRDKHSISLRHPTMHEPICPLRIRPPYDIGARYPFGADFGNGGYRLIFTHAMAANI